MPRTSFIRQVKGPSPCQSHKNWCVNEVFRVTTSCIKGNALNKHFCPKVFCAETGNIWWFIFFSICFQAVCPHVCALLNFHRNHVTLLVSCHKVDFLLAWSPPVIWMDICGCQLLHHIIFCHSSPETRCLPSLRQGSHSSFFLLTTKA